MPLNRVLPVALFLICIAIAVMLAVLFRPLWPAALAVAIAGAALALALRNREYEEGSDDYRLTALEDSTADLRAELGETRATVSELADLVEQVAAKAGEDAGSQDVTALRESLAALEARIEEIEAERLAAAFDPPPPAGEASPPETVHPATEAPSQLRALVEGAGPAELPTADRTEDPPLPVRLVPVFTPQLGTPVAFVVSPVSESDALPRVAAQTARLAGQFDKAGRDVRLFLRIPPTALTDADTRTAMERLLSDSAALRARLTLLTRQAGFDAVALAAFAMLAQKGCGFALEDVRDWSLDLAGLAQAGLTHIAVDGPAMAESAKAQGGDPKRLAEALAAHDIALVAGEVADRAQLDAVRTLHPVLVMGDGLGPSRVLESIA